MSNEYPKRMLESIKAVKEKRRQERLAAIQASGDHVKAELAKPSQPRRPIFRRPQATSRVAAEQELKQLRNLLPSQGLTFPYTKTKRARRYLHKHPGFPVEQHPMGGEN